MSDGRSKRWDAHRAARRAEFVAAAAAAIERHGPDAHLDEIAAEAGVSKPVLYRYFSDKDDLLAATAAWTADGIVEAITDALAADLPARALVEAAVEAYLTEVERRRNLFLLVTRHRGAAVDGSLAGGKTAAAAVMARSLGDGLRLAGVDAGGAEPWAHALVGLGLSTAEWWLDRQTMSREAVAGYLSEFVWHAFDGISREYYSRPETTRNRNETDVT